MNLKFINSNATYYHFCSLYSGIISNTCYHVSSVMYQHEKMDFQMSFFLARMFCTWVSWLIYQVYSPFSAVLPRWECGRRLNIRSFQQLVYHTLRLMLMFSMQRSSSGFEIMSNALLHQDYLMHKPPQAQSHGYVFSKTTEVQYSPPRT